jgi:hypothetical protein
MKITKGQTIPDHNLDDDTTETEECFSCGIIAELDVHGRCYDCGYADAHEYEPDFD